MIARIRINVFLLFPAPLPGGNRGRVVPETFAAAFGLLFQFEPIPAEGFPAEVPVYPGIAGTNHLFVEADARVADNDRLRCAPFAVGEFLH